MAAISKILKINALALLSFPLLLVSIGAKLLLKALEKALIFLIVGAILLGLLLIKEISGNTLEFFRVLGFFIIFWIFFRVLFIIVDIFRAIVMAIFLYTIHFLNTILSFIFQISHNGYAKIYDLCKVEYEKLLLEFKGKYLRWSCLFWYLLKCFNLVIMNLFSISKPISFGISIGLVTYSLYFIQNAVMKTFNIGLITYLKLFPVSEVIFAVLFPAISLLAIIIVIISLGIEWGEWGQLLKISTQDYQKYRIIMSQQATELASTDLGMYSFEEGKSTQRCQEYLNTLNEMYNDIDNLQQQVDAAMNIKYDTAIIYNFSEYTALLSEISNKMSTYDSEISCTVFERNFIPLIDKAQLLYKSITKSLLNIIKNASYFYVDTKDTNKSPDFFEGCATEEDLKKRYKALCKIYHPDIGGHEGTFKILQNQYEEKIKASFITTL